MNTENITMIITLENKHPDEKLGFKRDISLFTCVNSGGGSLADP